jgi:hypothetical protein
MSLPSTQRRCIKNLLYKVKSRAANNLSAKLRHSENGEEARGRDDA